MVNWVYVNSSHISKLSFDYEIKTMYIAFQESEIDTPYPNVSESLFEAFCNAENVDEFYEKNIKTKCEEARIDSTYAVNCDI